MLFLVFIILPRCFPLTRWASDGIAWLCCCQISWGSWYLQTAGINCIIFTSIPFANFLNVYIANCQSHVFPLTITLQIIDSIMALFRVDFSGRGELAERQQKLAQMLSRLQKISEGRRDISEEVKQKVFEWVKKPSVSLALVSPCRI